MLRMKEYECVCGVVNECVIPYLTQISEKKILWSVWVGVRVYVRVCVRVCVCVSAGVE
jgi:hypothetical protein